MNKAIKVSVMVAALMVSSAAVTKALTPHHKMADQKAKFSLEQMIPTSFGDWRVDTSIVPLQVDPDTQARLDRIYNQTLSRTYVNRNGDRVMLSLAYGGDQSDNTGLHRPEVCYAAQGFQIKRNDGVELRTAYGILPVRRLMAVAGSRNEPITYWVTVGDKAVQAGMQQKMQQLRLGLSGTVPDGMLVRVSTIDTDTTNAYQMQDGFINAMLASVSATDRQRLAGAFAL